MYSFNELLAAFTAGAGTAALMVAIWLSVEVGRRAAERMRMKDQRRNASRTRKQRLST